MTGATKPANEDRSAALSAGAGMLAIPTVLALISLIIGLSLVVGWVHNGGDARR